MAQGMQRTPGGLLVPRAPEDLKIVCPAGSVTRFRGSGRPAIRCGIERNSFAVEDSPVSALGWCCGDYADCPVWQSEKNRDPIVARQRAAQDAAEQEKLTEEQIRTGVRFDDRQQELGVLEREHAKLSARPDGTKPSFAEFAEKALKG
jgi:hypothetical protein